MDTLPTQDETSTPGQVGLFLTGPVSPGLSVDPIYSDLLRASSITLLEAAVLYYDNLKPGIGDWLRLGAALVSVGGWQHVAPAWLRRYNETQATLCSGSQVADRAEIPNVAESNEGMT